MSIALLAAGANVVKRIGDLITGINGTGEGFFDTITLGNMTVGSQFIGVSHTQFDFYGGLDGVLGYAMTCTFLGTILKCPVGLDQWTCHRIWDSQARDILP